MQNRLRDVCDRGVIACAPARRYSKYTWHVFVGLDFIHVSVILNKL